MHQKRPNSALNDIDSPTHRTQNWLQGQMSSVPSLGPEEMVEPVQKVAFEYQSTESKNKRGSDLNPTNRILVGEVEKLKKRVEMLQNDIKRKDKIIKQRE